MNHIEGKTKKIKKTKGFGKRKQDKSPIDINFIPIVEKKTKLNIGMANLPRFENVAEFISNFRPSEPCLARPVYNFDELKDLDFQSYIFEEKYDGKRLLSFIKNNSEPIYYSRNLKPSNFSYPIHLQPDCKNCLLDGELVYLNESGKILPFCDTQERFKHKEKYLIYDIQYYNGCSVMNKTLQFRKDLLKKTIISTDRVCVVDFHECKSLENVKIFFNDLIKDPQREGLILKSKFESYNPNIRLWLKIKTLHLNDMKLEMDLYVQKAYKDKNGRYSILECGDYDSEGIFKSMCKVSSGLTDSDRGKILLLVDENGFFRNKIKATIIAERKTINNSLRLPQFKCFRFDLN